MAATARDLLAMKNSAVVYTCPAGATVAEACRLLAERRVGALVVVEGSAVVGLFTERDVATRVVILKGGRMVANRPAPGLTADDLAHLVMTGQLPRQA